MISPWRMRGKGMGSLIGAGGCTASRPWTQVAAVRPRGSAKPMEACGPGASQPALPHPIERQNTILGCSRSAERHRSQDQSIGSNGLLRPICSRSHIEPACITFHVCPRPILGCSDLGNSPPPAKAGLGMRVFNHLRNCAPPWRNHARGAFLCSRTKQLTRWHREA
jgi:hypothetical protein